MYDYCDIVNLIVGIPMYKATLDAHYGQPLDVFVQTAIKVSVSAAPLSLRTMPCLGWFAPDVCL